MRRADARVQCTDRRRRLGHALRMLTCADVWGCMLTYADVCGALMRVCSARIDAGDLGMNYIAVNQIIELLIKAGADVAQV